MTVFSQALRKRGHACERGLDDSLFGKLNVWGGGHVLLITPEVISQNQGKILKGSHAGNR